MKKKSDTITRENYFEKLAPIGEDLVRNIVKGLQSIYVANYRVKDIRITSVNNRFPISFYLDINTNILYLYYELDRNRNHSIKTPDRFIYNTIFNKVRETARDYDIKIHIIGKPVSESNFSNGRSNVYVDQENQFLRAGTRTMWTISPKEHPETYFITSSALLEDDMDAIRMPMNKRLEFLDAAGQLNKLYTLPGPDQCTYMQDIFGRFSSLYLEYFGKDLRPVRDNDVINIYLDIKHNYDVEEIDPEVHDMGTFYNPHYVYELIRDHEYNPIL